MPGKGRLQLTVNLYLTSEMLHRIEVFRHGNMIASRNKAILQLIEKSLAAAEKKAEK